MRELLSLSHELLLRIEELSKERENEKVTSHELLLGIEELSIERENKVAVLLSSCSCCSALAASHLARSAVASLPVDIRGDIHADIRADIRADIQADIQAGTRYTDHRQWSSVTVIKLGIHGVSRICGETNFYYYNIYLIFSSCIPPSQFCGFYS